MTGTMIRIEKSTSERLRKLGIYGDTYDMIINRLIDSKR
jgi:hypothetical protein